MRLIVEQMQYINNAIGTEALFHEALFLKPEKPQKREQVPDWFFSP